MTSVIPFQYKKIQQDQSGLKLHREPNYLKASQDRLWSSLGFQPTDFNFFSMLQLQVLELHVCVEGDVMTYTLLALAMECIGIEAVDPFMLNSPGRHFELVKTGEGFFFNGSLHN